MSTLAWRKPAVSGNTPLTPLRWRLRKTLAPRALDAPYILVSFVPILAAKAFIFFMYREIF